MFTPSNNLALMQSNSAEAASIELEESSSNWFRISIGAGAFCYLVFAATQFFTKPRAALWDDYQTLLLSFAVCGFLIFGFAFGRNRRWIVRSNDIQVDNSRFYGSRQVEVVNGGDIREIDIDHQPATEDGSERVYIWLRLTSGHRVKSPRLVDVKQADELKSEIAKRFNVGGIRLEFPDA